MARNSLLDRFRPVGAPGPAGPAGVPAVDDEGTAAELIPVFEALDPDLQADAELSAGAAARAQQTVTQARQQAAALVEDARINSGAVRAEAAARVSRQTEEQDAQALDSARDEAAALEDAGASRVPELAAAIVADLVADLLGRGTGSP